MRRSPRALFALGLILGCTSGPAVLPPPPPPPPPPPFQGPNWQTSKKETPKAPPPPTTKTRGDPKQAEVVRLAAEVRRPARNLGARLGVNLGALGYRSGAWSFLDVFKRAGPWISNTWDKWDDGRRVSLGPGGWVHELLPSQYIGALIPAEDGGTFVATYEGDGIMRVERARVLSEEPGKISFKAKAGSFPAITVYRNELRDPLSNIRVVRADQVTDHEKRVFREDFLRLHERFKVLRFSGWSRVNDDPPGRWNERVPADFSHQYTERGVALEYMVILANRLGADLWVPVPHSADDTYLQQFAGFLKANLRPELKVYAEYSEEPWRAGSAQQRWCQREGLRLRLNEKPALAGRLYQAKRSLELFEALERALGKERIVRVLSAPLGENSRLEWVLREGRLKGLIDALAVAPRFGAEVRTDPWVTRLRVITEDEMLGFLRDESLKATLQRLERSAAVAKRFGVPLIGYDGGLRLAAPKKVQRVPGVVKFLDEIAAHPKVGKMYSQLLERWQALSPGTLVMGPLVGADARRAPLKSMADAPLRSARYQALMRQLDRPR